MKFSLPTLIKALLLFLFAISCSGKKKSETKIKTFDLSVLPKQAPVRLRNAPAIRMAIPEANHFILSSLLALKVSVVYVGRFHK